ncbi:translation initiation factor eIF4A [Entomortierella lignicola]|nr:translation initiation factor eIF4A [Entomortierella lignicola]
MNLSSTLLYGLNGLNFEKPSIVQQRAIPSIITGRDVVVQAQEKSGKTVALTISVLQKLILSKRQYQALILEPTRQKAKGTQELIVSIGNYTNIKSYLCTADTKVKQDVAQLSKGTFKIVVGTPGRILDLMKRGVLNPDSIQLVVMDEADILMSKGFIEQISSILHQLNSHRTQFVYFSYISLDEALGESAEYLKNPINEIFEAGELKMEGIRRYSALVDNEDNSKFDTLCEILGIVFPLPVVVYCNTSKYAEVLTSKLNTQGISAQKVHRYLERQSREQILEDFRDGVLPVLVATDVLWRVWDLEHRFVPLVINYSLPNINKDYYIHRICIGGSAGRRRLAISIVAEDEMDILDRLQHLHIPCQ